MPCFASSTLKTDQLHSPIATTVPVARPRRDFRSRWMVARLSPFRGLLPLHDLLHRIEFLLFDLLPFLRVGTARRTTSHATADRREKAADHQPEQQATEIGDAETTHDGSLLDRIYKDFNDDEWLEDRSVRQSKPAS